MQATKTQPADLLKPDKVWDQAGRLRSLGKDSAKLNQAENSQN